jgi:hypothetical protein
MTRLFWPDEEPLGKRIQFQWPDGPWFEIVGVVGALALSRFIETLLFEVNTVDPFTFVGVVLVVATVALVATLIPALRASRGIR